MCDTVVGAALLWNKLPWWLEWKMLPHECSAGICWIKRIKIVDLKIDLSISIWTNMDALLLHGLKKQFWHLCYLSNVAPGSLSLMGLSAQKCLCNMEHQVRSVPLTGIQIITVPEFWDISLLSILLWFNDFCPWASKLRPVVRVWIKRSTVFDPCGAWLIQISPMAAFTWIYN